MSETNKHLTDQSFEIIRQYLKSAVPPCQITVDTDTHFEVTAINNDKKELFGYCVKHQHVVTLGFNTNISDKDFHQLIPERLIKMMNEHRRLEIRDVIVKDLHESIQDACNNLLYYFNEKNWTSN